MRTVALDTNIAIDLLNGNKSVLDSIDDYDEIVLPVTVCGELMFGALNSGRPQENLAKFQSFIASCRILSIDARTAVHYANCRLNLKRQGKPIPENDIWISATCLANEVPLFSRDVHFTYIKELEIIKIT